MITAANNAGTLSYWWVADGSGLSWNPETVAANGTSAVYAHPGIAVTSSSVVITAINAEPGDVMYWSQPFDTNPWHKETGRHRLTTRAPLAHLTPGGSRHPRQPFAGWSWMGGAADLEARRGDWPL